MKERKWLRWAVLFMLAFLIAVPVMGTKEAQAATKSGSCGDNVKWSYSSSSGTLTISGSGDMYDYTLEDWEDGEIPWQKYESEYKKVVIKSGVTSIGSYAFYHEMGNAEVLKKVSIAGTVTRIGAYAFYMADFTSVDIPEGVEVIEEYAFHHIYSLETISLPDTLTTIGEGAFAGCTEYSSALTKVTIPASVTSMGDYVFSCCPNLKKVIFEGDAPTLTGDGGLASYPLGSGTLSLKVYYYTDASGWTKSYRKTLAGEQADEITFKTLTSLKREAEITLSKTSYTYNGKKRTPSVTVTVDGETLTKGTDYTVTYSSGRTAIGKYTVKIKGKGSYTGTVTKTFKIKPAKVSLKSSTKSSSSKTLTVKWSKVSGSVKYQIAYKVKGGSWKYKTVSASTYSKTLTGLKSGKYYYVKVRAYRSVDGTKYYGSWSTTKKVKVK